MRYDSKIKDLKDIINLLEVKESTIEKCLELEWEDKREVRAQSWKTIEMSLKIIVGILGAMYVTNKDQVIHSCIIVLGCIFLFVSSSLGGWICICHAIREWWIMRIISVLEKSIIIKKNKYKDESEQENKSSVKNSDSEDLSMLDILAKGDFTIKDFFKYKTEEEIKDFVDEKLKTVFGTIGFCWKYCFNLKRVSSLLIIYHIMISLIVVIIIISFFVKILVTYCECCKFCCIDICGI